MLKTIKTMLVLKRTYVNDEQPQVHEGLWLKKVTGGYALYLIEGGTAIPLKLVDDNSTATPTDDTVQDLVGSVQDESTANTINGAKNYADEAVEAVVGTAEDTAEDLTLYGLKAYIDSQVGG